MGEHDHKWRSFKISQGRGEHSGGGGNRVPNNAIRTTKYTVLTFLPKNLWEQLHKFGNCYFLSISIIMYLGEKTDLFVGTIKAFSTLATLLVMMCATAVMAALDDYRRYESDIAVNGQDAKRVELVNGKGKSEKITWSNIEIGNLLLLDQDKEIPADVLLLCAPSKEGSCYISTANLDGETNLKLKSAIGFSQELLREGVRETPLGDPLFEKLSGLDCEIDAEEPNNRIHEFTGRLRHGEVLEPLTQKNLLLRGAVLRNARWAFGMVVYTGPETRMMKNSNEAPLKYSNLERVTNRVMFVVLAAQASLALTSMLLYMVYKKDVAQYWYLYPPEIQLPHWLGYWLTFFVLYSNLMPISLYPTMEVCNAFQAWFIRKDRQMRVRENEDEEESDESDEGWFYAGVRSSNLCQELGQIQYIFSDKTGTLTQNVMKLRRIYVDINGAGQSPQQAVGQPPRQVEEGRCFGSMPPSFQLSQDDRLYQGGEPSGKDHNEEMASDSFNGVEDVKAARRQRGSALATQMNAFLEVLAVAHTVMASSDLPAQEGEKPSGPTPKYEAESPDEGALVEGVAALGWIFEETKERTTVVSVDGRRQEYTLLATNGFDSTRKRMSVLVQVKEDGASQPSHLLLVKGADNVMLENADYPDRYARLKKSLHDFSVEGLRTLVVGRRVVRDQQLLNRWLTAYQAAESSMEDRAAKLTAIAEEMETQLQLLGVTGIEDKLQEECADTIKMLRKAGIKLWIATGDKLETARNIGYSSSVLERGSTPAILDSEAKVREWTKEPEYELVPGSEDDDESSEAEERWRIKAVMITGDAWAKLNDEETVNFISGALDVPVVIACRVSPLQKAALVKLVREATARKFFFSQPPVCMAIGDGANDVTMLQEAQVGIGIRGKEGMQAVNNSDFYIGQFKQLQRLLLVHGRWNYRRTCKFTLYTFWRNAVQVLLMCFYTFLSGFSGTSLFEDWIRLSFNFLCSFPIMATGCFDKDIKAEDALRNPHVYKVGREGLDMGPRLIVYTLLSALYHSLVIFFVTATAFTGMDVYGAGDYYTFGTAVYSCVIVDMNYRVIYLNHTHNSATVLSIVVSIIGYFAYLVCYPSVWFIAEKLEPRMYLVPLHMAKVLIFWVCCVIAVPLLAMSVDMFFAMAWIEFTPVSKEVFTLRDKAADKSSLCKRVKQATKPIESIRYSCLSQCSEESSENSEGEFVDRDRLTGKAGREDPPQHEYSQQTEIKYFNSPWSLLHIAGLIAFLGTVLMGLGAWAYLDSRSVEQIRIHYHGRSKDSHAPITWLGIFLGDPLGTNQEEEVHDQNCTEECNAGGNCTFQIKVNHTMTREHGNDLLLYYAIEPFYQNYYDYMRSGVYGELLGEELDMDARARRCRPDITRMSGDDLVVPCGMEATSFFNDTIYIEGVKIHQENITWPSDTKRVKPGPPDYPNRLHTSWLYERYPDKVTEAEGATNEHFLVWSRPAALPRLWNHYGWIHQDLVKGQTLNVTIHCVYPVSHGMAKQFVITEVGQLGGRSDAFGGLLFVGGVGVCVLALVLVLIYALQDKEPSGSESDTEENEDGTSSKCG